MGNTIVAVNENGVLVNAAGINSESNKRLKKFSERFIGTSSDAATMYFGWDGRDNLIIAKGAGLKGNFVTIDADNTVLTGNLTVSGKDLDSIINDSIDTSMLGISEVPGETTVTVVATPTEELEEGQPRKKYVIGVSPILLDRISTLEVVVRDLFRFDEVYRVGDGLTVDRDDYNVLRVNIGDGLEFSAADPVTGYTSINVACDDTPQKDSSKPITSGGVYDALKGGVVPMTGYLVDIDSTTGNMILVYTEADSDDS